MTTHKHKWQRLSDRALFCECGETKAIAPEPVHLCPRIVYYPPLVVPYTVPAPRPYWQWPNTTYPNTTITAAPNPPLTGGTSSADMRGVTVWNG